MTTIAAHPSPAAPPRKAGHRYVIVLTMSLTLSVFEMVAPSANWSRAVAVAFAGAALTVTVATSREHEPVRRRRALVVAVVALLVVIAIATGSVPVGVTFLVLVVLAVAIPAALVGGLLRLAREAGVTYQAVAGALAIYLLLGLLFAYIVSFVAEVQSGPYFTQSAPVSSGDRVYYSFTVLTTTGFGDFTAAKPVGHALAVLEQLTGQLYLVTVIGILIGNYASRRLASGPPGERSKGSLDAQALVDAHVGPIVGSGGPASEIANAKRLLDSGAISQAEFDELKAKAVWNWAQRWDT